MENFWYFFPVFFIALWIFVIFIISRFAWAKMAAAYPGSEDFGGTRIGIISLAVNMMNYNNAIVLKYNDEGLYLKPLFLFRIFHKPVFIPWQEVKDVHDKTVHFFSYKLMTIGDPVVVKLGIKAKTFLKIKNSLEYFTRER